MSTALLLLVFSLLVAAVVAGTIAARQARRLPSARTPSVTTPPPGDPAVRQRPFPDTPSELVEDDPEEDATFRAFTEALEAHAKRADRKALYSNILFFAAGVLASILTTLLIHPL